MAVLKAQLVDLRTVLCVGAHPDDIEIGCGGTLLKLLGENRSVTVHWVVLCATEDRAQEAATAAEDFLRDAAAKSLVIKHYRDSFLPYVGAELKEFFHQLRGEVSPDLIFTHRREDMHQDHRIIGELTWSAFRDHLILEYETPKYDGDLGHPNVYVPLAESICRRKIEALIDGFPSQRSKPWFSEDTFRALLRLRGVECHSPSRFAEGLYCRKMIL